jgi:hypothetical protein
LALRLVWDTIVLAPETTVEARVVEKNLTHSATRSRGRILALALGCGLVFLCPALLSARGADFKFVGGTQYVEPGCAGKLELSDQVMTFSCAQYSITMPFRSIRLMEYRTDLSRKVRKMKLRWKVRPGTYSPLIGAKRDRYFTVVYEREGSVQALVLEVEPKDMRPYLAEIDIKVGHRVDVEFTSVND